MADYQLLGYHSGYPANAAAQGTSQTGGGQPGLGGGMLPGSVVVPPGQPATYHPRPGYPAHSSDPLMSHKMHQAYPGYHGPTAPGSSAIRSQYSQGYMPPHPSMDSYNNLAMGQSHMSASSQALGSAYSQHQSMMSQYPGQRMHAAPRHPMPSQYPSYGSSSQSSSSYPSGSSDLWSSGQSMSHLQQSPFSSFQSPTGPSSATSRSSQFAPSSDYPSSSSNPYFDATYPSSYPTPTAVTQASSSRSSSSSSRSSSQQQQYSSIPYSGATPSVPLSASPSASSLPAQQPTTATSNSSSSRFPPHYSSYPFDPSSQSRLSPYPAPTPSSGSQTPNSPQFRSSQPQHPVHSPRRSTATSPAGSPMPPTSHTPGPPSVGSNSTQGSNPGSAFSIATPSSSGHHLPPNSSSATPSSLQQLEQMVMPHLGSASNTSVPPTSKSMVTSTANSTSTYYPPGNATSAPISPQSSSKLFPHYPGASPSATASGSQFPPYHHQYPPAPASSPWQQQSPVGSSGSHNTHSLKSATSMMPQTHSSSSQHLTPSTTSSVTKSHSSTDSAPPLHQPYAGYTSSKTPNSSDSTDYSQSPFTTPPPNSHSSSSVSHSISQSGPHYPPPPIPPSSYESMTNHQKSQSSIKNDTQLFEHSKTSTEQSQLTSLNSTSYHSMMHPSSYGSQSMSNYPGQPSRFDSMPSQYGMSSELSNSSSYNAEHEQSMMYDPYNIDNIGMAPPPHQSMAEYRESQSALQQSALSSTDYASDPYAANFDDYETSSSKRKGKGRPKKDPNAVTVKKERKPRQPRAPSTRGRGRGRGAKNMADRVPLPGMMADFGDATGPYGAPPMMGTESMDMYANNVDMYPGSAVMTPNKMLGPPVPMPSMMPNAQVGMPPSVLPSSEMYGPPPSQPAMSLSQSNTPHMPCQSISRSPVPPIPSSAPQPLQPKSSYDLPDPSYSNYGADSSKITSEQPSVVPPQLQNSSMICDNNKEMCKEPTKKPFDECFLSDPLVGSDNSSKSDTSTVPSIVPPPPSLAPPPQTSELKMELDELEKPVLAHFEPNCPTIAPPPPAPTMPMYPTEPAPYPSDHQMGHEHHRTESVKSPDSDQLTIPPAYDPSLVSRPLPQPPSAMSNSIDLDNSIHHFATTEDSSMQSFTTSTPVAPEKSKKKRKSKKQTIVTDQESIDEVKPKPKKKRTKKSKTEDSTDFDDNKSQTSNFDNSSFVESEVKPPRKRGKSRKSKASKSEVTEGETLGESSELIGDTTANTATPPPEEKVKKPRVKNKSPKKKLPKLALKLKQNKKRRRGFGSPDNSDMEKTPPPSPLPDDESASLKRRSARNTKRQRYNDDIDLDLSDEEFIQKDKKIDENQVVSNVQLTEDTMVVERIMSSRMAKREIEPEEGEKPPEGEEKEMFIEVEEYYVKYKNLSYLHCDWKTEDELEKGDRRIGQKIRRYKQKKDVNVFDFLEDEPFNPDYIDVDRVLDVNEVEEVIAEEEDEQPPETSNGHLADADETPAEEDTSEKTEEDKDDTTPAEDTEESAPVKEKKVKTRKVRHFLVKWRGLSYEESTWELEDDIDPSKIQQFWKFREPPPKSEWKIKKRPKASEWRKLDASPVYKNSNTLREYQLEGVNWLSFCWHNGQNCILADEMGLGKTIQSITFIQEMVWYGIPYPYLVIAPLSTIGNWQREFETWTDLNVVTYHGSSASRNMLQEYELYYKNEKNERIPNIFKFQVMITTFEVILSDCVELSSIKWVACIIDEAHRLKNRNCKLLEGLRMLSIEQRVLLTGTPLQNNVEELFSLLHFLEPSQFTSNESFMTEFGDLKTEAQVDKLKAILKPMMLRRLKEDVEKSLAPKEETIIEVELTNIQKKYYRAILERNFQFLSKGGTYANMPNLMNTVMELRKCCIHPFLINGAEDQILHEYRQQHGEDTSTLNAIIQSSGKLVLIDKLLPRLKENGHRVLIFSQMVRCLDILEDYLCQKRYPFERIDGRVRGNLRQAAIDRFSKPDSDRFVFLLCTRAGGLGINLTAADTVIIFDSDWNPQNDLQAQARCHRIGQKKSVKVYRLICRNTYEREMFDRASLKLGLDKAVLQSMNAQKNLTENGGQMSKKEIEDLLRKGAYGALMEDDAAGDKFCEEDIDMILQRRTTKIIIESEGKGSTFSKASFATSDNRTDIEIDDPNFWEKWAKKANFDLDELKNRNELIVQEPRRRTQTKRFGADDAVMDISELETSTDEEDNISSRTRGSRTRSCPKKGGRRRGRNYDPEHDEDYAQEIGFGWTRSEFLKVEKGLLTFGWNRWDECLILANFKRNLTKQDVEDISRVVLLFALQNYKGDEKVKSFILDLITPASERNAEMESERLLLEQEKRSRKSKKMCPNMKTIGEELETLDWAKNEKYNPDIQLIDDTYRKHLLRHANKILLRVRLLAYIKNEIVGDHLHEKVFNCMHVRDIPIPYCKPDGEPPALWWNEEADKSLVIGVYKHGYDRYNLMRQDPALCFLARCGPPDGAALMAEMAAEDDLVKTLDDDDEPDTPATPATPQVASAENGAGKPEDKDLENSNNNNKVSELLNYLPFPTSSEMNNRLRRLITCYQRNFKKEEARIAQKARHMQRLERIEKFEAAVRERELKKREQAQKKWSRREESDFYRVVSSFGVEYDRKTDVYEWTRFRMYAKLERKLDDTLTEYYKAFYAMCKKVVGRRLTEDEENLPISVDPITEERANRCLARIELLQKVRDDILNHPELDERLKLCQPQLDLPEWWVCGKHDKDLLIGAAKYGLSRLDYNLMNDPDLSFVEVIRNFENQFEEKSVTVDETESEIKLLVENLIDQVVQLDVVDEKEIKTQQEESETIKLESQLEERLSKFEMENPFSSSITTMQPKPSLKWPRDRVLQIRLENVSLAIEKNEWPTFRGLNSFCMTHSTSASIATADSSPRPSTPCSLSSASQETPHPTPDHTPRRDSQSPFTGEFFYAATTPSASMSNNVLHQSAGNSSLEDGTTRRRRRRRKTRYDVPETDRSQMKLHSLLNSQYDHHHHQPQHQSSSLHSQMSSSKLPTGTSSTNNSFTAQNNSLFSALFGNKNAKTNPLLQSQILSPLLAGLPQFNRLIRDDMMSDEKSLLLSNALVAAMANASKNSTASTSKLGLDSTKSNLQSGPPPPAHQSSSRNTLSLGSLDLTSKFKTSSVLEKLSTSSRSRSNLPPFPAHKPLNKSSPSERADVLDLSSVQSKNTMSTLLEQSFNKKSNAENASKNASSYQPAQSNNSLSTAAAGGGKKRGRTGSRIDALALNLQAKKMMEEEGKQDTPSSSNNSSSLSSKLSQPSTSSSTSLLSSDGGLPKDLFAALGNFPDKRSTAGSSGLFDEMTKTALLQSMNKNKNLGAKKSTLADSNKAYFSFLESMKPLLAKANSEKQANPDKMKQIKSMFEQPDMTSNSALASLFYPNLSSFTSSPNVAENKEKNTRSSSSVGNKRTRSQYEQITTNDEPSPKRSMMNLSSSMSPSMDQKKYLSNLLDSSKSVNIDLDTKIKNMIKEKSGPFKPPSTTSSSSMRTRTSDKRTSSASTSGTTTSSSSTYPNMNASSLLNNLSLAAAAASGSSKQQQQQAASLLANPYANAFSALANSSKTNPSSFSNFANLGFNSNLLSNISSMKMFLDSVSKNSTSTSSTSTISSTAAAAAATSTPTSTSASAFANLFGNLSGMSSLTNPLFNFPNFANLAGMGQQTSNKKDAGASSLDLAAFANLASASGLNAASGVSDDKSKGGIKSSTGSSFAANKGKSSLNSNAAMAAAAASVLGNSANALPFLYPNAANFMYNPLSFGLTNPNLFLNNPNLMNGLANFSNVFTSTTSTSTAMASPSQSVKTTTTTTKAPNPSLSSSTTRTSMSKTSTSSGSSAPSGLSLASGLLAGTSSSQANNASSTAAAAAAIDSDDESLKSLMMGNDDEDDLNGDFETEEPNDKEETPKSAKKGRSSKSQSATKDSKSKRSAAISKE